MLTKRKVDSEDELVLRDGAIIIRRREEEERDETGGGVSNFYNPGINCSNIYDCPKQTI